MQAAPLAAVPAEVLAAAVNSARLVGSSFYGVDLKSTAAGVYVMEINVNPNLDAGVEDADRGDALSVTLFSHFLKQVESRYVSDSCAPAGAGFARAGTAAGPAHRRAACMSVGAGLLRALSCLLSLGIGAQAWHHHALSTVSRGSRC